MFPFWNFLLVNLFWEIDFFRFLRFRQFSGVSIRPYFNDAIGVVISPTHELKNTRINQSYGFFG